MKRRYRQQQSLRKQGLEVRSTNLIALSDDASGIRPRFNRWSGQYESGWFVDALDGNIAPRVTDKQKHVVTIRPA